jgi:hypothetical protein
LATGKKEKMLFASGEKSKQDQVTNFFKALNNGESKQYPNASMMLVIPFNDGMYMPPPPSLETKFYSTIKNSIGKVRS